MESNAVAMTFDLPPLQGALLWGVVPRVETLGAKIRNVREVECPEAEGARHEVPCCLEISNPWPEVAKKA